MEDKIKRYLDRVVIELVRGTEIDYEKGIIIFPFSIPSSSNFFFPLSISINLSTPSLSFSDYCRNQFGLTDKEIKYVFNQWREIIKDKISNKES